jgi:hypothetical protein
VHQVIGLVVVQRGHDPDATAFQKSGSTYRPWAHNLLVTKRKGFDPHSPEEKPDAQSRMRAVAAGIRVADVMTTDNGAIAAIVTPVDMLRALVRADDVAAMRVTVRSSSSTCASSLENDSEVACQSDVDDAPNHRAIIFSAIGAKIRPWLTETAPHDHSALRRGMTQRREQPRFISGAGAIENVGNRKAHERARRAALEVRGGVVDQQLDPGGRLRNVRRVLRIVGRAQKERMSVGIRAVRMAFEATHHAVAQDRAETWGKTGEERG